MLWQARQGPWENGVFSGPGSGVFKSTDGGTTWRPIVNGLPTFADDGLGRIGIAVAPSNPPAAVCDGRGRADAADCTGPTMPARRGPSSTATRA